MFNGKVVIVTGSSAGIGAGTAVQFAREGAGGIVLHGRNEEALNDVKRQCETAGKGKVHICVGDITDATVREKIIDETIQEFGKLDILVNNAGISKGYDSSLEAYDATFEVNVRSVVALTQLATPHLIKTGGNIVNISSVASLRASGMIPPYYFMSKAALDHYTKCLALDLGPKGVRVNSVNPGLIPETTIFGRMGMTKEALDEMVETRSKTYPLRRAGLVSEVADLILFVASDKAKFITGTILPVDGGYTVM